MLYANPQGSHVLDVPSNSVHSSHNPSVESAALPPPIDASGDDIEMDLVPIVIIEGFMSPCHRWYWGPVESILEVCPGVKKKRKVFFVTPGSGSSLHDRAIEVYYQLKGGHVDYGEEHANEFKHARYSREYKGLYPEWSREKPLHFFAHSLGGPTIYKLQHLLDQGFFPPSQEQHPDMVLSLTAISSPWKGSTFSYVLGQVPDNTGAVFPNTFAHYLVSSVRIYEYLDFRWLKNRIYDFHMDHWHLSWRKKVADPQPKDDTEVQKGQQQVAFWQLWKGLVESFRECMLAEYKDHAGYDISCHGVKGVENNMHLFGNTYYRNIAASMTKRDLKTGFYKPGVITPMVILYLTSYLLGQYQFPENTVNQPIPDEELHQWYDNDGVCPTISQVHPKKCSPGYCVHHKGLPELPSTHDTTITPSGMWDVWEVSGMTHFTLLTVWLGTKMQRTYYDGYRDYLRKIDEAFCKRQQEKAHDMKEDSTVKA